MYLLVIYLNQLNEFVEKYLTYPILMKEVCRLSGVMGRKHDKSVFRIDALVVLSCWRVCWAIILQTTNVAFVALARSFVVMSCRDAVAPLTQQNGILGRQLDVIIIPANVTLPRVVLVILTSPYNT